MGFVSPEVVILTKTELQERLDAAFQKGVARGTFEALDKSRLHAKVAEEFREWVASDGGSNPIS